IITGSVPTGYQLDSVDVQPSEIAVAGSQRFLDSLSAVQIYSINVNSMKETTTKTTRVNRQSDMRYLSTEEVLVTLHISEKQRTHVYEQLTPELTGEPASPLLRASAESGTGFKVTVTGPYTQMAALERDRIRLFVDVSGLTAGTYELPVHGEIEDGDDMDMAISPATVTVTIE
ncbi:MAG: YbbR-like domain-containing protein, partial [Candidatus Fimadaptatus sp.]